MITIVSDSGVNLPAEFLSANRVVLVPAYVILGGTAYRESADITLPELLTVMDRDGVFPKTSQPIPADFMAVYRDILTNDPSGTILSLHLSGELSGTVDSARTAANDVRSEFPDSVIHVVDTRVFSIAQALIVREAAWLAGKGESIENLLARLADMSDRLQTYFVLDTVEYLYRGGRIGRVTRTLGSMLNIKPIITIKDGIMDSFARVRTQSQALKYLREIVEKAGQGASDIRVAVGYAVHSAEAEHVADALRETLHVKDLLLTEISAALGVYAGPGVVGVSFYIPEP